MPLDSSFLAAFRFLLSFEEKEDAMKKVLIFLLLVGVAIQFIQPDKNITDGISENDISKAYSMPVEVHLILQKKCYDCHSNHTNYPWYVNIQPVAWWMDYHINEGKKELNFSEFKTYNAKKANHKLEELSDAVTNGWMPLEPYVLMHKTAKITSEDARLINDWITAQGIEKAKPNK
jgi:hypothetical protein